MHSNYSLRDGATSLSGWSSQSVKAVQPPHRHVPRPTWSRQTLADLGNPRWVVLTKLTLKGLKRGSAIKSTCCFYIRPRFSSQHQHSSSPTDAQRSQDAHSIHIHSQHTHIPKTLSIFKTLTSLEWINTLSIRGSQGTFLRASSNC